MKQKNYLLLLYKPGDIWHEDMNFPAQNRREALRIVRARIDNNASFEDEIYKLVEDIKTYIIE